MHGLREQAKKNFSVSGRLERNRSKPIWRKTQIGRSKCRKMGHAFMNWGFSGCSASKSFKFYCRILLFGQFWTRWGNKIVDFATPKLVKSSKWTLKKSWKIIKSSYLLFLLSICLLSAFFENSVFLNFGGEIWEFFDFRKKVENQKFFKFHHKSSK